MTFIDSLRNYLSPQILVILCLGFISGVPYGVLMDPLNYWLSEEGIEKSTGEHVIVMDTDFTHDPILIKKMISLFFDYFPINF